ncbi:hypothetical protein Tsubulata_026486 [Turnera subulata]|uniref:SnoaL-like domain-containing protein n=1 Tax=Turnera subulata TaxID=218843 RepID=A0A9Q0J0K7_9ROSI|nr:hypothetical protein Tsubulata_026486 [Turnera subulata]
MISYGHTIQVVSSTGTTPFVLQAKNSHSPLIYENLRKRTCFYTKVRSSPISYHTSKETLFFSRRRGYLPVQINAEKISGSGEEENKALETVLKLYTSIKNQNVPELSDMFSDECRCICNFFSFFQPFQGKQQVLAFFNSLITFLGKNFEFVVQPTLQDGLHVGVRWRLKWNKTHMPVGKGFSFYILQEYQGKVVIRNVEMFMEPLFHVEPLRLKLMGCITAVVDQMSLGSFKMIKDRLKRIIQILFLVTIILLFVLPAMC